MSKQELKEFVSPKATNMILESKEELNALGNSGKNLYMSGIFIQGGIRNANQRIYPVDEISKAVKTINDQLDNGYSILGEIDHPTALNINLDRVSHSIVNMWMEGPNGYGKLRIHNTTSGIIIKTLLEEGVKLGVSSRGSGNVSEDGDNVVSDYEIITVDIVATPSGPGCYPTVIYEGLMNQKGGYKTLQMAKELQINKDPHAQRYIAESLKSFIKSLK